MTIISYCCTYKNRIVKYQQQKLAVHSDLIAVNCWKMFISISDNNTKSLYKSIFSYWTQLNIEWFLNSDVEDYFLSLPTRVKFVTA